MLIFGNIPSFFLSPETKEIPLKILQKQFDISKKIDELIMQRSSAGMASPEDIIKAHQDLIDSELAIERDDGIKRLILVLKGSNWH